VVSVGNWTSQQGSCYGNNLLKQDASNARGRGRGGGGDGDGGGGE